jgi:hypothetical protein
MTGRVERLRLAHRRWLERRNLDASGEWPGPRYVLLHTLSHLLIREIALECGYSAASIRERLYSAPAGEGAMAGIPPYTAAPDSEGTLGGAGRPGQARDARPPAPPGPPPRPPVLLRPALRPARAP